MRDIHFPTPSVGYFVGQGGLVLRTTDAGGNLEERTPAPGDLNYVRFFDSERGIAVGFKGSFEDGTVLFRFDIAAKSLRYHVVPGGPFLRDVHCPEAGRCIAVGDHGSILAFALP